MQVNSAQDWVTKQKRRILAKTSSTERSNATYLSAVANGATQRERFVAPFQGAWGGASGGASYSSDCCLTSAFFQVRTDRGVVPYTGRSIQPLSYRAT